MQMYKVKVIVSFWIFKSRNKNCDKFEASVKILTVETSIACVNVREEVSENGIWS